MNLITKLSLGLASVALVGTSLVSPAFAKTRVEEKTQNIRCNVWDQRVDARINHFNAKKANHVAKYNEVKAKINNLINDYKSKGYDTAKLEADVKTLDGKIVDISKDYQAFVKRLEEAKQLDCGDSEGAYKQAITEAKQLLATTRADAKDIRNYYQTVIKPDLQALKNQNPQ